MNTQDSVKLTLLINKKNISEAKRFARQQGTSLSKMVEALFTQIVWRDHKNKVSPLVNELSGVIGASPQQQDLKKSYRKHLSKKYQ